MRNTPLQYPNIDGMPPVLATKTDSVIRHMQYQIDSLSKVVNETKIAHGFFSDVISQDLYMFTTIVFFAGLITWGSIYTALALHKRQIKAQLNKSIAEIDKQTDTKLNDISVSLDDTIHNVNRAMYSKVLVDKDWPNSFAWAMACVESFPKYDPNDPDGIDVWLGMAEEALDQIPISSEHLINSVKTITGILTPLTISENETISRHASEILKKFNHKVYTIPTVPEDLFSTTTPVEEPVTDVEFEEPIE